MSKRGDSHRKKLIFEIEIDEPRKANKRKPATNTTPPKVNNKKSGPSNNDTPPVKRGRTHHEAVMQQEALDAKCHKGEKINKWDPKKMARALELFWAGHGSMNGLAAEYKLPTSTFRKRCLKIITGTGHRSGGKGDPRCLSKVEEQEIADHVDQYADCGFALTQYDVRKVAYDYAMYRRYSCFKGNKDKLAGEKWLTLFMERHPQLKKKKAHDVAVYRANSANPKTVGAWFQLLQKIITENCLCDPRRFFNCDETGIQDIPDDRIVIGIKGKRAWSKVGADKGKTTSVLCCSNAVGESVEPVVILKGTKVQPTWIDDVPLGVKVKATKSAYISRKVFADFGRLFIAKLRELNLDDGPVLLLMDSHSSHVFNWEFIRMMNAFQVTVLAIPPHTSHVLQPLDRGPFYSLKNHWNKNLYAMVTKNGGRALQRKEWFEVFLPSIAKAITVDHMQSAFRVCGIYPLNSNAINPEMLGPSAKPPLALEGKINQLKIRKKKTCNATKKS